MSRCPCLFGSITISGQRMVPGIWAADGGHDLARENGVLRSLTMESGKLTVAERDVGVEALQLNSRAD